jgi:pimeloyl-ACP methyl ester carboxylesterase
MAAFWLETGIPAAADESLDDGAVGPASGLMSGLAAIVIKPAVVGGVEAALAAARWSSSRGVLPVVSSAFESSAGTAALAQLAAAVDAQHAELCPAGGGGGSSSSSGNSGLKATNWHGLGTLAWFEDPVLRLVGGSSNGSSSRGDAQLSLQETQQHLKALAAGQGLLQQQQQRVAFEDTSRAVSSSRCEVETAAGSYSFRCLHMAGPNGGGGGGKVLLLHGFLGCAEDWLPAMQALSPWASCTAVDLPGHGSTSATCSRAAAAGPSRSGGTAGGQPPPPLLQQGATQQGADPACTLEAAADALAALVAARGLLGCTLVGYSLGARLALVLVQRHPQLFSRAVVVSGTAGLEDPAQRAARAARDDVLAGLLQRRGLRTFLELWYGQPLWAPLRRHPRFEGLLRRRASAGQAGELARALRTMSAGRMGSLWGELAGWRVPLLLVAGELDGKFVEVGRKMLGALGGGSEGDEAGAGGGSGGGAARHRLVLVPRCGHAVQEEQPLLLAELLRDVLLV